MNLHQDFWISVMGFMSDLKRNYVISPWLETVCVQTPELVQDLSELLAGLLTVRKKRKQRVSTAIVATAKRGSCYCQT